MGTARETAVVVAHPWHCDALGHMNTRHILAVVDEAGFVLLDRLGYGVAEGVADGLAWADVRIYTTLAHEIRPATVLTVLSRVTRVGGKSFTHVHEVTSRGGEVVHAVARVTTARFDLRARRAVPLPADFAARAEPWFVVDEAQ
jgi:acyl-CoA thioester hydrolase